MDRTLGYIAIAIGMLVPTCQGQSLFDQANFSGSTLGGVRLYGTSVFSGYSTSAYPQAGLGQASSPGLAALGSDETYGASATLGWQRHREKTNLSIMYSGSYAGNVHYSDLNAYSQSVSIDASRTLNRKWTVSLSASGQDSSLAQFLFEPSTLSVVSQLPVTFDDLAASFSIGQFSNTQVASMLTGAPVLESPARSLLLGERVRSYSAKASLGYAYSSRLSFHFGSLNAGGQNSYASHGGSAQQNYSTPRSLGANGGVGMSYALSPRTQLGVSLEEYRQVMRYLSSYSTTVTGSVGRKMGMHWFLRGEAGGSFSQVTQLTYGKPRTQEVVGGGSLGFKMYTNTFLASYNRSTGEQYGFAVGTSTMASGTWNWHPPASRWGISTSFGQQQMRNTGFASISGWQGSAGVSERLSGNAVLMAQYVYLNTADNYLGSLSKFSVQSVRVSLNWAPQVVGR
jgi:hypothetical protein